MLQDEYKIFFPLICLIFFVCIPRLNCEFIFTTVKVFGTTITTTIKYKFLEGCRLREGSLKNDFFNISRLLNSITNISRAFHQATYITYWKMINTYVRRFTSIFWLTFPPFSATKKFNSSISSHPKKFDSSIFMPCFFLKKVLWTDDSALQYSSF